jgi:metallo-beta-lactamase family protein
VDATLTVAAVDERRLAKWRRVFLVDSGSGLHELCQKEHNVKLHFIGANRQVTGSRYCLQVGPQRVLIDCGMFQERQFEHRNWEPSPIKPSSINAMLLTHAHLDHCGLIPRFVKQGMNCPIYCTAPTAPLTEVILRDSAEIQAEDLKYKLRRHQREGRKSKYPDETLYDVADVESTVPMLQPQPYRKSIEVVPGVTATFYDAGHILGSSSIEVVAKENGDTRTIIFSGDIGQWNKPIIHDPTVFQRADYVVMESTYGDRDHEQAGDIATQLANVVNETAARGGKIVIPTFAVERAQELTYYLSKLVHAKRIPPLPIYLDSPMAVDVTAIYTKYKNYFDDEMWELIRANQSPIDFPGLQMVRTADASKAINNVSGPAIIMASSGMCNAGRIKHHLRNNIEKVEATILFVGHQGDGTLGRQIIDGARQVRIHGQTFRVEAHVAQIYGFSGHADRTQLLKWLAGFQAMPRRLFLTHGEEDVAIAFGQYIEKEKRWHVRVLQYNEAADLE